LLQPRRSSGFTLRPPNGQIQTPRQLRTQQLVLVPRTPRPSRPTWTQWTARKRWTPRSARTYGTNHGRTPSRWPGRPDGTPWPARTQWTTRRTRRGWSPRTPRIPRRERSPRPTRKPRCPRRSRTARRSRWSGSLRPLPTPTHSPRLLSARNDGEERMEKKNEKNLTIKLGSKFLIKNICFYQKKLFSQMFLKDSIFLQVCLPFSIFIFKVFPKVS
jgi:hypothetical protein